jgi:pyruvate,water dikinase
VPTDLRDYTVLELIQIAERIGRLQMEFGPHFQTGNFDAAAWYEPLEQTIERWRPGEGRRLASALMAGTGQVVSAEHGYRLFDLARAAAVDPGAQEFLANRDWHAALPEGPFSQAMRTFLDNFGHRGIYEAELANPRWSEDPSFVFDQVRRILADGALSRPDAAARERRADAERVLRQLPLAGRLIVRWLAGQSRAAAARREAGKSALIAMALPVRRLLLEFGRRLVELGVLDDVDDVFHLARADLEAFARGEWDGRGARTLVEQRRQLRQARLAAAPPPDLIELESSGRAAVAPTVASDGALRGIAASPGRARGPARLILHPEQADRLQRGDVLIAPSTDPGWTPLFLRCAAVVTEVGGYLSHGAIVAREFGLPAVVNVPRVLELIADGEPVTVDGDAGLVFHYKSATFGDAMPARP